MGDSLDAPAQPVVCPCGLPERCWRPPLFSRGRGDWLDGPPHCARALVEGTGELPADFCIEGLTASVKLFLEQRRERADWPLPQTTLEWWPLPAGREAIRQWWRPRVGLPPTLELEDEEDRIGKGRPPRPILQDKDARIGVAIRRGLPSGASLWLLGLVSSLLGAKDADIWAEPVVLAPELRTAEDDADVAEVAKTLRKWYTTHLLGELVEETRGLTAQAFALFREQIVERLTVVLLKGSLRHPRRENIARDLSYTEDGLRTYLRGRPEIGIRAVSWATLVEQARQRVLAKKGSNEQLNTR